MSKVSLAKRFQDSNGAPILLEDGRTVSAIWTRQVQGRCRLRVHRLAAKVQPTQGLRLRLDKGMIFVNAKRTSDVVLWTDNSPETLTLDIQPSASGGILKVWNVWRDAGSGTMQAWLGDAGLLIQDADSRIELRCSDAVGSPDFSDLVVRLEFETVA